MKKLIIANWKMEFTHKEAPAWLESNIAELHSVLERHSNQLIICPSYTELNYAQRYTTSNIRWGAQNCSAHIRGPYTGEISLSTLKELGCTLVLIGHSERRIYHNENNATIVQKVDLCLQEGIEPIICIGETFEERQADKTFAVLQSQIAPLIALFHSKGCRSFTFAYEPVWAIGTQHTPRAHEISTIFKWIKAYITGSIGAASLKLLYGGSVNEITIADLGLTEADGFMLGKASLSGEVLKKIISSC